MVWFYVVLLFVNVVIGVIAQISLKKGVNNANIGNFSEEGLVSICHRLFFNSNVWFGGILYALSIFNWIIVLTKIDLSFAYPAISSSYFFVALISKLYFKEYVSWKRWLSIAIIILGITILALGSF